MNLNRIFRYTASIVGIVLLITACMSLDEPQIRRIDNITYKGISDDGLNLEAKISLFNPNTKTIKVHNADLDIFLENSIIGKITVDQLIILEPQKETQCKFSVKIDPAAKNKLSFKMIGKIIHKDVPISFKGTIRVQTGIFKKTVAINETIQKKEAP